MQFTGKLIYKEKEYIVSSVEKPTSSRFDVFAGGFKSLNIKPTDLVLSLYHDYENNTKEYYGDLDLHYVIERIMREARLYTFNEDEIEESEEFEEGKLIFTCNQKSERFEYNYKSENMEKVYKYLRTPEASLELTLTDPIHSITNKHIAVPYKQIEVINSGLNEDSLILSRIATISELREKYDLTWLRKKNYVWIESMGDLKKYLRELRNELFKNNDLIVALDTETTGLNIYHYPDGSEERDKLVSIVLTWKKDFSIYIPIAHKYEKNLPEHKVIRMLSYFIGRVKLLTQNGMFDNKVFKAYKRKVRGMTKLLRLNIIHDLLLENYILQPNPKRGSRGLKENVWKHLGIKQLSLSDLFPPTKDGKMDIRFELLPRELALIYACPDVDLLLYLHEKVYPTIPKISLPIYNTEVKFIEVVSEAEYYGLKVNMKRFEKEKKLCYELVKELEQAVYSLARYRFNLNSPDQVSNFLYNRLGCEILISSKTNPAKGSTSSKALKNLAKIKAEEPNNYFTEDVVQEVENEDGSVDRREILKAEELNKLKYPVIKVLLEYRNYSKLLTSFFNNIEETNRGGRLFSWINQTGAQTGRTISPLQTLPPFIKTMIEPDTSEHGWLIMDYRQIELRLMFGLAGELELIKQSENPDNDIHRIVAARIYQKKLWEITSDLRGKSKSLNFGIPYSLGDYSLATTLYGFPKNDEHLKEIIEKARADKRRFFEAMPRVEQLFIKAKQFVQDRGFIFTKLGRGFYYESILEETNRGKIARTLRQAGNGIIQGLGADILKKGAVDLHARIKARDWDQVVKCYSPQGDYEGEYPLVRQAMFVHDEVGIPYHKKSINPLQVLYEVRNSMQIQMPGFPPLFIGAAIVNTWAEAKDDKFEIPTGLLNKWCDEVEQGMHTEPLADPMGWVYNEIKKYNEDSFRNYIDELKEKLYKEGKPVTIDNLGEIFRHDVLTHQIVAMYGEKEYQKEYGKKPTHEEHISYAVRRYVNDFNIPVDGQEQIENEPKTNLINLTDYFRNVQSAGIIQDDQGIQEEQGANIEDLLSQINSNSDKDDSLVDSNRNITINKYNPFEANEKDELIGIVDELDEFENPRDVALNYQFDDTHDDEYEDAYYLVSEGIFTEQEYEEHSEQIREGFSKFVTTVARRKIIKVDSVTTKALTILRNYLQEHHTDDGLYEVRFMSGGKIDLTRDAPYKVDKIDDVFIDLILTKTNDELDLLFRKTI